MLYFFSRFWLVIIYWIVNIKQKQQQATCWVGVTLMVNHSSANDRGSLKHFAYASIKSSNNPGGIPLPWNCPSVLKSHIHHPKYNLGQNIYGLFHFLAQFVFTTSETELEYYQQKVNVNFNKILEIFWAWWRVPSCPR